MTRGKFQYVFLNQLTKGKQDRRVLFRIIRLWETYNTRRAGELMSIDFLILESKVKCFAAYVIEVLLLCLFCLLYALTFFPPIR
jgi:hypothetical protein